FRLSDPRCKSFLERWTQEGTHLQPEARNKIREWFDQGLNDWDISRDAPYFGFEIPGAPGKYFYVWLDAPIGYFGSFKNLADRKKIDFDAFKMSKSRGTFITAESYIKQGLNPEWLRYYYATKLGPSMEDIDLNLEDFVARVNSDLVGKYVNIVSRCAAILNKQF